MASPTSSPQPQQQLPAAEQWRPSTVVYLLVLKGDDVQVDSWKSITKSPWSAPGVRYTRDGLRSLLLLMGVKWRYANLTSKAVFQQVTTLLPQVCLTGARKRHEMQREQQGSKWTAGVHDEQRGEVFVSMPRKEFQGLIMGCLAQQGYKYSMDDLRIASSLRERRRCLVVLLCGTSGSGKSTLASLLASRLGITTVLSTDSVRHMLRSFHTKETAPLVWASTYEAGSVLAGLQKQQLKDSSSPHQNGSTQQSGPEAAAVDSSCVQQGSVLQDPRPPVEADTQTRCIQGYKAQSQMVLQYLQQLIAGYEARCESAVVEGVHLSISQVARIMQHHPCVVPFLLVIKSADKHVERMAVRAKYMTLEPGRNKYVAHMQCIRWIQEYLIRKAEQKGIPRVENTNVDRSVNLIHMTLLGLLRRVSRGETVWDSTANAARLLMAEYAVATESLVNTSQGFVKQLGVQQQGSQTAAAEDTAHAFPLHVLSEPSGSTAAVPLPLLRLRAEQEAAASSSGCLVGSPPTPVAAFLGFATSEAEAVLQPHSPEPAHEASLDACQGSMPNASVVHAVQAAPLLAATPEVGLGKTQSQQAAGIGAKPEEQHQETPKQQRQHQEMSTQQTAQGQGRLQHRARGHLNGGPGDASHELDVIHQVQSGTTGLLTPTGVAAGAAGTPSVAVSTVERMRQTDVLQPTSLWQSPPTGDVLSNGTTQQQQQQQGWQGHENESTQQQEHTPGHVAATGGQDGQALTQAGSQPCMPMTQPSTSDLVAGQAETAVYQTSKCVMTGSAPSPQDNAQHDSSIVLTRPVTMQLSPPQTVNGIAARLSQGHLSKSKVLTDPICNACSEGHASNTSSSTGGGVAVTGSALSASRTHADKGLVHAPQVLVPGTPCLHVEACRNARDSMDTAGDQPTAVAAVVCGGNTPPAGHTTGHEATTAVARQQVTQPLTSAAGAAALVTDASASPVAAVAVGDSCAAPVSLPSLGMIVAQGSKPPGPRSSLLLSQLPSSSSDEEDNGHKQNGFGNSSAGRPSQAGKATPFANAADTPQGTDAECVTDLLSPLSHMAAGGGLRGQHGRQYGQRRSAGSSILQLTGHSSAAESDRDHLQQLDYASIYDSTAVYDDELDELDDAMTPSGNMEFGPGEQPSFYSLYTQHEGLPDTQGLLADNRPVLPSPQADTGPSRGRAVPGRWGNRSNSTMLRHFASAIARTRQRAGQNAPSGRGGGGGGHAGTAVQASDGVRHPPSGTTVLPTAI